MAFEFPGLADVGLVAVGELADAEPETLWWIGEGSAGVLVRGAVSWWVSGGVGLGRPFRALGFFEWLSQGVVLGCDRARRWRFDGARGGLVGRDGRWLVGWGGVDGGLWEGMDGMDGGLWGEGSDGSGGLDGIDGEAFPGVRRPIRARGVGLGC